MIHIAVVVLGRRIIALLVLLLAVACGNGGNNDVGADSADVRERDVTFETSDGIELAGRLFGEGRVGVVLAHMYPSDARSWYHAAREISASGYLVLAFNFRGYEPSGGANREPARAHTDLHAAKEYLQASGIRDVAFVGASMGGTAAVVAAGTDDPLAIIAISAPTRFMGLDAIGVATTIQRPVLLISSRDDSESFRALQELERALPNPDTKVYGGDAHGTNLLEDRPEAVQDVINFLKRYAPLSRDELDVPNG